MIRQRLSGFPRRLLGVASILAASCTPCAAAAPSPGPRIVNIVNFIRLLEPRDDAITEEVLYNTVVEQIGLMDAHRLPGTFLLQYDALMDDRYRSLLKSLPEERYEIGAWWELPQPLVEKAGLEWRGRFPWDWHANVGFVSGYSPAEREKLADVYMADFQEVFGRYPESVASWFIDAHTLSYLHEKYGVIASANCKDQIGTDGYTLWGGYWNQAYYPSKRNAYMPAQTEAGQIPVPVFRMLGSDPLRQYSTGVGGKLQGVVSLEPIYQEGGRDPAWVDWFLENLADGECLAFNYAQAGQENSFTWEKMAQGLLDQFPKIAALRHEGELKVETLAESGRWYRDDFRTTPATAMTFATPLGDDKRRAFWYNSRFYRANFVWDQGDLLLRDLHLFDESVESDILRNKVDRLAVEFFTLPVVDGNFWGAEGVVAGLRVVGVGGEGSDFRFAPPRVQRTGSGDYQLDCPLESGAGTLLVTMSDGALRLESKGIPPGSWELQLRVAPDASLPFVRAEKRSVSCEFRGASYRVDLAQGVLKAGGDTPSIQPESGVVALQLDVR